MTVIEQEAKRFSQYFLKDAISIKNAKEKIEQKLHDILLDKDKLSYLNVLRHGVESGYIEHKKKCTSPTCSQDKYFPTAMFTIDQQIEYINKFYTPSVKDEDKFSLEEQVELHQKINKIVEELEKIGIGQEIIFNEIDDLKEHLNLGKKNWLKFLKGTIVTLGIEKSIEKSILDPIFQTLSEGLENTVQLLD